MLLVVAWSDAYRLPLDVLAWIGERLAGRPARSTCRR
jgi:hypothetical protein